MGPEPTYHAWPRLRVEIPDISGISLLRQAAPHLLMLREIFMNSMPHIVIQYLVQPIKYFFPR